ncbi:MAG: hypothetical protein GX591_10430 [Planctomycetes bacterium]|nr:hypothetical protein [Planctomycetota bacterium]
MSAPSDSISRTSYGLVHCVVAAAVLMAMAAGMVWIKATGFTMAKAKVPLHKELDEFPKTVGTRFALWQDLTQGSIVRGEEQLTDDIVKVLGTEKFIGWWYLDRQRSTASSAVIVRFHMAYYTGLLDAAPHVPENCQVAGGRLPDEKHTMQVVWTVGDLPEAWSGWREVTVRRAAFVDPGDPNPVFSYYVFSANGQPMWDRNQVRGRMSDPWEKHCYYMKIEVSALRSNGQPLTPEESDEICGAFFADALPLALQHVATAADLEAMEDAS